MVKARAALSSREGSSLYGPVDSQLVDPRRQDAYDELMQTVTRCNPHFREAIKVELSMPNALKVDVSDRAIRSSRA
jgi:hypothetical protein